MTQAKHPPKKEKKAKPILQPESESDLAWGIKFFAEGIQGLTKKMEKPTSQAQYEHNQQLIEKMKAEIKAKESIKAQYEEYKALYDRLKALQAEQKVCEPVKKKGIFK